MADDDAAEVDAFVLEYADLIEASLSFGKGVGADWDAGAAVGAGCGAEEALIQPGHLWLGGCFDYAGVDAGVADALFDVLYEEVGDGIGWLNAEIDVVVVVQAGGDDDLHTGLFGRAADVGGIATEGDRRQIDDRADSGLVGGLEVGDGDGEVRVEVEAVGVLEENRRGRDKDVFVGEGETHVIGIDRSGG